MNRFVVWAAGLALVGCVAGCGGGVKAKPVKTSGVLVWEDGSPVGDVTITFAPVDTAKGMSASALTGKDGTFEMTTKNSGDGVVPGEYKVVITQSTLLDSSTMPKEGQDVTKAMAEWAKKQGGKPKAAVPAVFTKQDTTPLKWTVEGENKDVKLKVRKS